MKTDLSPSMQFAVPQLDPANGVEEQRERFIANAETLVSDDLKQFIREVQRYAPPYAEMITENVTVTVEGSYYADPSRYSV